MRFFPVFLLMLAGCATPRPAAPPRVDFLLVSGDSTYWVTGTPDGLRVRGSPLLLARYGGRFHEVYVADDDHSYEDALLVGQLVYSRDLITNDSTLVYTDTLVDRIAKAYAAAHPDDVPLDTDEQVRDRPLVSATSDIALLDVHGPYLSLEYHADTRRRPDPAFHATWRTVVDMRVGHPVGLENLIGTAAAARVVAQGRRSYADVLDTARLRTEDLPDIVPLVLAEVHFDPRSFNLTQANGRPAVAFAGRMAGRRDVPSALPLPAVPIDSEAWWGEVRPTLPTVAADGASEWRRAGYTVRARAEPAESADADGRLLDVTVVDSARHAWTVGRVHAPLRHVFWLDQPPVDSTTRRALQRAFDEAAMYDDNVHVAGVRLAPRAGVVLRAASNVQLPLRPAARGSAHRRPVKP